MEHYYGNSNYYHNIYLTTPWFSPFDEYDPITAVSFDAAFEWWSAEHHFYFQKRTSESDGWSEELHVVNPSSGMTPYTVSINAITDSVQFRFQHYYRHYGRIEVDNFQLLSVANTSDPVELTRIFFRWLEFDKHELQR